MATKETVAAFLPSDESQKLLIQYVQNVLTEHKKFNDYKDKMAVIDVAYARYQATKDSNGIVQGQGVDAATTPVGVMNLPSTTPPVVISQVDSMVGYLADTFLSGYPIFPVVSDPMNKDYAEQLETLIDDHATLGGYARQLLMFFRDGIKYNFSAIEVDWAAIDQYTLMEELLTPGARKLNKNTKNFNKLNRLDPYNTIWDHNCQPGDISSDGDYAGYIEIKSRTKLKRLINRLSSDNEVINAKEALASRLGNSPETIAYYNTHPQVSDYIKARNPVDGMNWYEWMTGQKEVTGQTGNFEIITLYARIIPNDFKLNTPSKNTPQIWKLKVVNNSVLVQAKRIISAYDYLPILFGQPLEDGLGYQTQSVAESNIPFQQAAATLMNIRFNSARRAVSDRALYDADVIKSSDINAPVPAAKIPVKMNSIDTNRKIADYYHQIPFDSRGTESTMQDAMSIVAFGKDLSGINNPRQGQFQKGNKSVKEWDDTMGGSDSRLRLPALTLEFQVFMPMKEIIKLNIFQYGDDIKLVSQQSGNLLEIDISKLREVVLSFRIADGFTPKSKLASTESILQFMQLIGQSQLLQQAFGVELPGMAAHLAQLMGIRGMKEYVPNAGQINNNMIAQGQITSGVDPRTGQPFAPQAGEIQDPNNPRQASIRMPPLDQQQLK